MIKKTKEYEMFKRHPNNRDISSQNLQKIIKSIQIKNLLSYRPILVDHDMYVIDGQHRLEAAKALGLEVYFEVNSDVETKDMILLNENNKVWGRDDYLNYYVKEGVEEYCKLKTFMERNQLSLPMALAVLGQCGGGGAGKLSMPNKFKGGDYRFPSVAEEVFSTQVLKDSQELVLYLFPKLEGNKRYIMGPKFRRALYIFLSIKAVDFSVFLDRVSRRLDLFRSCVSIKEYVRMFKRIYNYHNRNPIFTESDGEEGDL